MCFAVDMKNTDHPDHWIFYHWTLIFLYLILGQDKSLGKIGQKRPLKNQIIQNKIVKLMLKLLNLRYIIWNSPSYKCYRNNTLSRMELIYFFIIINWYSFFNQLMLL